MNDASAKQVRWSREKIVASLVERQARGMAMNATAIRKSDGGLAGAICRFFGPHHAALRAACIDPVPVPPKRLWTRDRIVTALQARQAKGMAMNDRAIQKTDVRLSAGIYSCFGSHDAALRAAGIEPESVRLREGWSKGKVVAALRERQATGLGLNDSAIRGSHGALRGAIRMYFHSHDAALRAAAIDPASARKRVSWDKASVVQSLRDRQAQGAAMNFKAIERSDLRLAHAMVYHWGGYDAALRAAGIDPASVRKRRPDWTGGEIIDALRGLARDGVLPWPLEASAGVALVDAARRRFGSIKAAAQAAGLHYERAGGREIGHWTEEVVLQTLRDLHRDGHDLRYRFMKEHSQPLFFAAKEFFGSYVNAVRQAGIDYWQMSQAHLARDRAAARDAG